MTAASPPVFANSRQACSAAGSPRQTRAVPAQYFPISFNARRIAANPVQFPRTILGCRPLFLCRRPLFTTHAQSHPSPLVPLQPRVILPPMKKRPAIFSWRRQLPQMVFQSFPAPAANAHCLTHRIPSLAWPAAVPVGMPNARQLFCLPLARPDHANKKMCCFRLPHIPGFAPIYPTIVPGCLSPAGVNNAVPILCAIDARQS